MNYALIILCGGHSSRMGTDKSRLPFGSESLLQYQIRRFHPYFSSIYISVRQEQYHFSETETLYGCTLIPDMTEDIGPMGGLYSCLSQVTEDIIYFNAVDTPFSDPKLAVSLCRNLEHNPQYGVCLIQDNKGRPQPLQGAYSRKCLPDLKNLIRKKQYALRTIFDLWPPLILDGFFSEEQFFNMNDRTSYYHGLQILARKYPGQFPPGFHTESEPHSNIPVISFTARSGTGKTTYLEKLIPLLKKEGIRIAILKHDAHGFQIDKPGKDSYRLTAAGADHMILTSCDQTAAVFSHPGLNPDLHVLLSYIGNVDLIIIEGYKMEHIPKIELLRKGWQETPVSNPDGLLALISDFPYPTELPLFDLNSPVSIIPFIKSFIKI